MKLEVKTAAATQSAVPEIGRTEKKLYYLIIGEDALNSVTINVGEKTFNAVTALIAKKPK